MNSESVSHSVMSDCDPVDCSSPGSSVHGFLQARILEWVAIPFSRASFWPRDWTQVACNTGRFFTVWAAREVQKVLELDNYFKAAILSTHVSIRENLIMINKKINFLRRVIKTIRNKQKKIDSTFLCVEGNPLAITEVFILLTSAEKAISPFDPQLSNHISPSLPPFCRIRAPINLRVIFWEISSSSLRNGKMWLKPTKHGVKLALQAFSLNGTPLQYSCLENPMAEEPGRLQSMGSLRVRHNWATSLSFFTFMHWRRKWQPTPVFLPGESQGQGSLVGCRLWGRTESDMTEVT